MADISSGDKIFNAFGNININIDKSNHTNTAIGYVNIVLSSGALPIITVPTMVTLSSSTIIDHIITNDLKHNLTSFVIPKDMTDHFPIGSFIQNLFFNKRKRSKRFSIAETNPNVILKIFVMMFNRNFSTILLKC